MIADPLGEAIERVRAGGLLAYPTETVWGLGADATSEAALAGLRRWKGRGDDAPCAVLVDGVEGLEELGCDPQRDVLSLADAFWPGAVTLVLPSRRSFARGVAREDGALGLRSSSHPLASALARRMRREGVGPLTATSFNRTGSTPARIRTEAVRLCGADLDGPRLLEVEGAEAGGDTVSTVVDLTGSEPVVLRWGAVSRSDLSCVLPELKTA